MKRTYAVVTALASAMSLAACGRPAHDAYDARKGDETVRLTESVPVAKPVERGALGDTDLRVMFAELASTKACKLVSGQFRPLRAVDQPEVVTGLMWIRDCKITNVGTKVTFVLSGNGWQWADQQQHKAGGTFAIHQYVKFAMTATLPGALDVAYDRHDHVLSVWLTPAQPPDVKFTPVSGIDVHTMGTWSAVVGALGTVFADSPESLAKSEAKDQGGHQLAKELADGLSVTVNLCTGLSRFALGREPKGKMGVPDAGETKRVPIDLQSNALMVFGPQEVGDAGFTANVESANGTVHVELACRDQAETLAAAYAEGRALPTIKTLAAKDILGSGSLRIGKANCQVSLIARPAMPNGPAVRFDWQRPPAEVARSTGGPLISCGSGVQ